MNHNLTLITLALLAVGAASQAERAKNKERADARPEQPVAAAALAPEQYAAFKKPVVARVVPEIISRPVGPMSFVSGTSRDLNLLNQQGGFEPMAWRPLLRPVTDSARGSNVILFGNVLDTLCPPGMLDGARVRVYQAANGKLELIRDAALSIRQPGVAHADVTSAHQAILQRKPFLDTTGNGSNHPNDFLHRVYAMRILEVLNP